MLTDWKINTKVRDSCKHYIRFFRVSIYVNVSLVLLLLFNDNSGENVFRFKAQTNFGFTYD